MLAEEAMSRTAVIFTGGGPARRALPPIGEDPLLIAADGGVAEAERLGFAVELLVGDLDSATPADVERVRAAGGRIEQHPTDKDASDLELALDAAVAAECASLVAVGGDGGRLDHLLAELLLFGSPSLADVQIDAVLGDALLHVVRRIRDLEGSPGELISLFALGGPAAGVRTEGLRWRLENEELLPGSTRGLSNLFDSPHARIEVGSGVLVAIRPGDDSP
jgi:thiamine pyrophosphokinase